MQKRTTVERNSKLGRLQSTPTAEHLSLRRLLDKGSNATTLTLILCLHRYLLLYRDQDLMKLKYGLVNRLLPFSLPTTGQS